MTTFVLPVTRQLDSQPARVTVDSELMKNYIMGTPVSAQRRMVVCRDQAGMPLVFTIGTDDVFCLIKHVPGSSTGWESVDLSSAIAPDQAAVDFDVTQNQDGSLQIALVLCPKTGTKNHTLYITGKLPTNSNDADWAGLGKQFVQRPLPEEKAKVKEIQLGTDNDGQGAPLAIALVETGRGDSRQSGYYRINMDPADISWNCEAFPMPQDIQRVREITIGCVEGNRGMFVLYDTSTGQSMVFTGLADPAQPDKRFNRVFELPGVMTQIAILPGEKSCDVFAGGEGLYVFPASAEKAVKIWDSQENSKIQELAAIQDGDHVSLWLLAGRSKLFHVDRQSSEPVQWTVPLSIREKVAKIAVQRDHQGSTGQIFLMYRDTTLAYLYQDPATTFWSEMVVTLPGRGKVQEFNCYTTHVHFEDDGLMPLFDLPVDITASEVTYAIVNGKTELLDPDTPLSVTPDIQGNITLINRVDKIATPIFHLTAQRLDSIIDVNPASKVNEGLGKIASGNDLSGAKLKNGQPLLNNQVDQQTLDAVASGINQLVKGSSTLPSGGVPGDVAQARSLSARGLETVGWQPMPEGQPWAMKFSRGHVRYVEGDRVPKFKEEQARDLDLFQLANVFVNFGTTIAQVVTDVTNAVVSDTTQVTNAVTYNVVQAANVVGNFTFQAGTVFVTSFGDFWESISVGAGQVGQIVVQAAAEGLKVAIEIGKAVFNFVLTVAREVYKVIDWILENTLGIDLDKVIEWLGFIFEWEDIKKMHKVIVNIANQSIKYGQEQLIALEPRVANFFDDLKSKLNVVSPPPDGNQDLKTSSHQSASRGEQSFGLSELLNTPAVNWISYQVLHGGASEATWNASQDLSLDLVNFMEKAIGDTVTKLLETFTESLESLTQAFSQGMLSVNDILAQLGTGILADVLDGLKEIVVGLIEFAEEVMGAIMKIINQPIDLPFIGEFVQHLYQDISGSQLTILDGLALLVAIPTTIIYKIVAEKSPLENGVEALATASYEEIFGNVPENQPAQLLPQLELRDLAEDIQFSTMETSTTRFTDSVPTTPPSAIKVIMSYFSLGNAVLSSLRDVIDFISTSTVEPPAPAGDLPVPAPASRKPMPDILYGMGLLGHLISSPLGIDNTKPDYEPKMWSWTVVGNIDMMVKTCCTIRSCGSPAFKAIWGTIIATTQFGLDIWRAAVAAPESTEAGRINSAMVPTEKGLVFIGRVLLLPAISIPGGPAKFQASIPGYSAIFIRDVMATIGGLLSCGIIPTAT